MPLHSHNSGNQQERTIPQGRSWRAVLPPLFAILFGLAAVLILADVAMSLWELETGSGRRGRYWTATLAENPVKYIGVVLVKLLFGLLLGYTFLSMVPRWRRRRRTTDLGWLQILQQDADRLFPQPKVPMTSRLGNLLAWLLAIPFVLLLLLALATLLQNHWADCLDVFQNDPETEAIIKVVFAQRIIIMQPDASRLDSTFLKYLLLSQPVQQRIHAKGTGATVQGIKASLLKLIEISFPKLISEQQQIVAKLDALREETQRLESLYQRKLAALDELKKSLLHQAFSGML